MVAFAFAFDTLAHQRRTASLKIAELFYATQRTSEKNTKAHKK